MILAAAAGMSSCAMFNQWLVADGEDPRLGIPASPWKRDTTLNRGSFTEQIAVMAAIFNDQRSGGAELVEQKKQELAARKRGFLPRILPIAAINEDGDSQTGISASMSILDFGRSKAAIRAAEIDLERAYIDYWKRRNDAVEDALLFLVQASATKALLENTFESREGLEQLLAVAEIRLSGGVADQSEPEFVRLRIAELDNEINRLQSDLASALALLSTRLGRVIGAGDVPELEALIDAVGQVTRKRCMPDNALIAPTVLLAKLDEAIAKQEFERSKAERIPEVIGDMATLRVDSAIELTGSISLDSGFASLLSGGSQARASEAAMARARSQWLLSQTDDRSTRNEIYVSHLNTLKQLPSLADLIKIGEEATTLFLDQRAAGSRQLTDGVAVYRSLLDARNQYNQIQALQIRNSIRLGSLDGRLTSIGPTL